MKITGTQLRNIIKEVADSLSFEEVDALEMIEEMGYDHSLPITHMENQVAIRDAMEGYGDEITMVSIESAVRKEAVNIANRPAPLDPVMLQVLYEVTPADEMEGWDDDPGLWSHIRVYAYEKGYQEGNTVVDSIAIINASPPVAWQEFVIAGEDIKEAGGPADGGKFFDWLDDQGAKVVYKIGKAPPWALSKGGY